MQISTKDKFSSGSVNYVSGSSDSTELGEEKMNTLEFSNHPVKRKVRAFLRRVLSPRAFQLLRYWSWCLVSYIPRLVACKIVIRKPQVRGFSASPAGSYLAMELQSVNVLAPTKMCRIMTKYGSDKGRSHRYTAVYSALFKEHYNRPLRILELGLGSNNLDVPSNMGVFGAPGASLRGWRELLPHAQVYGADIDRRILFQENRIKTFFCDQLDQSSVSELWSHPDLKEGMNVIIEDGLHTFEANVAFLQGSLNHLRPGGIYITEDIMWNDADKWYDSLENVYSKQYPNYEFAFLTLPGKDQSSTNMVVIRRSAN